MKKFIPIITGLVIGALLGVMTGFIYASMDIFFNLGRKSVTDQITQSLQVIGNVPITYKGEQAILQLVEPE